MAKAKDLINDIAKLRNKLKRNDERINDSTELSKQLKQQIDKLNEEYNTKIAPDLYVSVECLKNKFGDKFSDAVLMEAVHVSKLKDFKWEDSKFECFICQSENHMNLCADNSVCDRKLDACIGSKCTMVQVKHNPSSLFGW